MPPIRRIEQQINKQTEYAVEKADVLFFLIDGKVGVTNEDRAIASYLCSHCFHPRWLRKKQKSLHSSIFVVVNKVLFSSILPRTRPKASSPTPTTTGTVRPGRSSSPKCTN